MNKIYFEDKLKILGTIIEQLGV